MVDDNPQLDDLSDLPPAAWRAIEAGRSNYGTAEVSESGVDLSQLRYNLALTPSERIESMRVAVRILAAVHGTARPVSR